MSSLPPIGVGAFSEIYLQVNAGYNDIQPGTADAAFLDSSTGPPTYTCVSYDIRSIATPKAMLGAKHRLLVYVGSCNTQMATIVHAAQGIPRWNMIVCPGYADIVMHQNNSVIEFLYDDNANVWRPVMVK